MSETMSPREKVERAIKDAIRDDAGVGLQMTLTPRFMRGLVDRVLDATAVVDNEANLVSGKPAALASSGDHAELAGTLSSPFNACCYRDRCLALIAEVAALRETNTEAERKLAEAVGLNERAADLMRQCTDPERFEGASTLTVYANMRAWLSDLPPAPGAEA